MSVNNLSNLKEVKKMYNKSLVKFEGANYIYHVKAERLEKISVNYIFTVIQIIMMKPIQLIFTIMSLMEVILNLKKRIKLIISDYQIMIKK